MSVTADFHSSATAHQSAITARRDQIIQIMALLMLGIYPILFIVTPVVPSDDLLRHVVSSAWNYSHREMFPMSTLPDYNLYPLFDYVASLFGASMDPFAAAKLLAVLCSTTVLVTAYGVCLHWARLSGARREDALLIALLLIAAQAYERSMLGRPESWGLAWALWATTLSAESRIRQVVVLIAGAALSMSYWLAPLLFPLVLLSTLPRARKVQFFIGLVLFHMLFWAAWTKGDVFRWPAMVSGWNASRPFPVKETLSSVFILWRMESLPLWILAILGLISSKSFWTNWAMHAGYMMTNIIRIGPLAFGCLLRPCLQGLAWIKLPSTAVVVLCLGVWATHLTTMYNRLLEDPSLPHFALPKGSRVLTPFNGSTFSMVAANPGRVEVFPPMEVGAAAPIIAKLTYSLWHDNRGPLNCREIWEAGITHIVEKDRKGVPACLKLASTEGKWRLWTVSSTLDLTANITAAQPQAVEPKGK